MCTGVSEPRVGVRTRDGVLCGQALPPPETVRPHRSREVVHVSIVARAGAYTRHGHMPPRHQASEPAGGPRQAHPEAVRLRVGQGLGERRAQRGIYMFKVL